MTIPADLSQLSDEDLMRLEERAQGELRESLQTTPVDVPRILDPVAAAAGAGAGWHIVSKQLTGPGQTIQEAFDTSPERLKTQFSKRLPEYFPNTSPKTSLNPFKNTILYRSEATGSKGPFMEKVNELGHKITRLEPSDFYDKAGRPRFPGTYDQWKALQQEAYRLRVPYTSLVRSETATPWAPYQGAHTLTEFEARPPTQTPGTGQPKSAPKGPNIPPGGTFDDWSKAQRGPFKTGPQPQAPYPTGAPQLPGKPQPPIVFGTPNLPGPGGPPSLGGPKPPGGLAPTPGYYPLDVVRKPSGYEKAVEKVAQGASKVPGLKQGLSYLDKQGTKLLQNPWTRRGLGALGGAGAGMSAYDAVERGRQGDYIGAGLSGLSAGAYGLSLAPHPIPKAVGFLGGLAIDQALLPMYDKYQQYKKNPQQAGPLEVDYTTQPIS